MGKCPYCNTDVNPRNLLFSRWRWSPRCRNCHRLSAIPFWDRFLLAGLPGGLSVIPAGLLIILSRMNIFLVIPFAIIWATAVVWIISLLLAHFARFEPTSEQTH